MLYSVGSKRRGKWNFKNNWIGDTRGEGTANKRTALREGGIGTMGFHATNRRNGADDTVSCSKRKVSKDELQSMSHGAQIRTGCSFSHGFQVWLHECAGACCGGGRVKTMTSRSLSVCVRVHPPLASSQCTSFAPQTLLQRWDHPKK